MSMITINDLRSGCRARISQRELCELDGLSSSTHEKDRSKGRSRLPFQKDDRGRVWYETADVLRYLESQKFTSTGQYDTSVNLERLERARQAKSSANTAIAKAAAS